MKIQNTAAPSIRGNMFAVPIAIPAAATVAEIAKADFLARAQVPACCSIPAADLRATLRELAPQVRRDAELCDSVQMEEFDRAGNPEQNILITVPPLVAHFALVALALVDAENEAPKVEALEDAPVADVPPTDATEASEEPSTWPEIAKALRELASFAESIEKGIIADYTGEIGEAQELCAALELGRAGVGYLSIEFKEELERATEWRRKDIEAFEKLEIVEP